MTTYRSRSGRSYTIGKELKDGKGGEGTVYTVEDNDNIVIKLYHPDAPANTPQRRAALEKKLIAMIDDKDFNIFYDDGYLRFAWPSDLVYDQSGTLAGFVMPHVKNAHQFHELKDEDYRQKFDNYDYLRSIAVSYNLAQTVKYVHEHGYVMGDMNIKNFMVDKMCRVIVLDTDSFDLSEKLSDPLCKCCVGQADFLAPELLNTKLNGPFAKFTRESDYFSLAVLIFQLLMDGHHPFGGNSIDSASDYSSSNDQNQEQINIAYGNCPYVRENTGKAIPSNAPDFNMLPAKLQALFRRTFCYDEHTGMQAIPQRATAQEFLVELNNFYKRSDKVVCAVKPWHIYLARMDGCPFCARDARYAATQTHESEPAEPAVRIVVSASKPAPKTLLAKIAEWFKNLIN